MANEARERARAQFEDAVYRMFEAGYDEEMIGEEVELLAQDWRNDYGAEPPRRAGGNV